MGTHHDKEAECLHKIWGLEDRLRLLKKRYKTMWALHSQCIATAKAYRSASSEREQDLVNNLGLTLKALSSAVEDLEKGTF
tara:strand:- start:334 stop:576 length:243 start_codon:yes stop_codon:yes gene_type:complete